MAAGTPDLVITEISLSPPEPSLGNEVTITAAIKNQGDANAKSTLMTCYLDDTILSTRTVETLDAGITATVAFTWTATGGSHTIKAIADVNEALAESDENNNSSTYSLTTLAADLTIESITWSPTNPSRGDNIVISIIIKNQGTYRSQYSNFDFMIDGGSRGITEIAPINPGNSTTKTFNWSVLSGEHTFKAVVDDTNYTKEGDETNNELTATLNTMASDLTIEKIVWSPESPSKDDAVSFNVTITNLGTGRADISNMAYYIDDMFINSIQVPALNAGASCNVTFTWTATLDAHSIRAAADYLLTIHETNEGNNELEASLITQPPDLTVSDLTWLPLDVANGDAVTFTATIENRGGGRAEASQASFAIDGSIMGFMDFPAIPAGEKKSLTITWTAVSGTHAVRLISDHLEKIVESNELNNRYDTSLTVALPDLIISSITFSPVKPALDETVTFTITVKNQGKGDAEGSRVACYIDNNLQTIKMMRNLNSGESGTTTYDWKITGGHHVFKAIVDDDRNVTEADEKNNSAAVNIAPDMPDLAITNVSWSPADIVPSQEIVFSIDIENIGSLDAGVSRIVFYVDDTASGYNDIDPIKTGEKITRSFTWPAAEGQHTISIVTDSKAQIQEIDETNNTAAINIPPPDLTVENITYSPQDFLTGDKVVITAAVTNKKGNDTPGATAECYVDGFSIGSGELPSLAAGESHDVSFEWTAEPGAHSFKIIADIDNTVMETDETNNEDETISATTTPDLEVGDIGWQTYSHLSSNEVTFTVQLKNNGACESGDFSLQYSFDDGIETVQQMTTIPGGGTAELIFTAILATGEHTADIILDIDEKISETEEGNNHRVFSFSTAAPDLVVRSITWSPITADIGDSVTLTVKVENLGLTRAFNTNLSLIIDGAASGSIDIPEIDTGTTLTLDFPWTAIEGEHKINVQADASQSVAECNETNNTRDRTISFTKREAPGKPSQIINPAAAAGGGLLETWWWLLLVVGGLLGLIMLYSTIRNMRKR
jgi:uncharacterized repeat protein (TIGR01451 family)